MRLLDALAVSRAHAESAVKFRDAGTQKNAADKQADLAAAMAHMRGLLKNVGSKVTGFFSASASERAAEMAKKELVRRLEIAQLTSPISQKSMGSFINSQIEKNVPAAEAMEEWGKVVSDYASTVLPGGRTKLQQEAELFKSIGQGLENKKPTTSMKTMAVMALGGGTAASILGNLAEKHRHEANLRLVMDDPNIPASHKVKAQNAFQILANYAPSIANDPIFSKDFVRNLVRFDMIDHKIVSDLILAEKNFLESKGKRSSFMGSMRDTAMGVLLGSGG